MPRQKKEHYEWVASLGRYRKRIKDVDGKYVPIYGKTEDKLSAKLEEARAAIAAGLAAKASPTVAQYAETWLALVTPNMRAKHRASIEAAVRLHIIPMIGGKKVAEVLPNDCIAVLNALDGRSASLRSKVNSAMNKLFRSAVDNRVCLRNPAADLKAGGAKAKEKVPLTEEQKEVLLDAVRGTRAETFVMLGLYTGMRREEILGLTWQHVHLENSPCYINVRKKVEFENNSRPIVSDELKSAAAYRTLPLPYQMAEHLQALWDQLPKEQRTDTNFVIGGDRPLSYQQFRNLWAIVQRRQTGEGWYWDKDETGRQVKKRFVRLQGEKSRGGNFFYTIDFAVTPHILRHTYITDLILGGANPRRVQYLAGHEDIKVTMEIYTHLVDNSPEKLFAEVEKAFGVKSEVKPPA